MKTAGMETVEMNAKGNEKEKNKSAKAKTAVAGTSKSAGKTKGPYLGSSALDKAIVEFCHRSERRQKNSYGMSYDQGDDIRKMIALIEGKKYAHLKRRPNNADPYAVLAGHPECSLGMKQMRRYVLFADTVDAIKKAGYEVPVLGLTYYVEALRLKSVESIIETLNQVVKDDLSVRELIGIVDQIMPPKKKTKGGSGDETEGETGGEDGGSRDLSDWKKSLAQIIGATIAQLAPIAQEMADKKAKLDKETEASLRKLQEKIQEILGRAE